jgi:WD40 repeat protein
MMIPGGRPPRSWIPIAPVPVSHAVDERLGPAFRDALHRFARRWNRRRALHVFCDYVTAVDLTGDGRLMATGGRERVIRLWDVPEHRQMGELDATVHWQVTGLTGYTTARAWNLRTGQEIATLRGHTTSTDKVAFTPDGSVLASASWDSTIRLWDVENRAPIAVFNAHGKDARGAVFATDGLTIATVSNDFTAMVWNVDPEHAARRVCALVGRDITPEEWSELVPDLPYRQVCR